MEVNQTRIFFHSCSLNISGNLWAIFRCWKGGLISMHVHQKKSIIDLIFYDSQNLLPLFSVHYIVNTDISLSFRVVLPFHVKNFLSHILGFYSSQHFHICFIPLGDNLFSYSYCRNSINFSRDNQTDVFRQLILNITRIMGFLLAAIFF